MYDVLMVRDDPPGAFNPSLFPILSDPTIDLRFAHDATEAFYRLQKEPDLIIFDLDLPPGRNHEIQVIDNRLGKPGIQSIFSEKESHRLLGCYLLPLWLNVINNYPSLDISFDALRLQHPLNINRILVYSVAADACRPDLKKLGLADIQIITPRIAMDRFFLHRLIKNTLQKNDR